MELKQWFKKMTFSIGEKSSAEVFLCLTLEWGHLSLQRAMTPVYHKLSDNRILEAGNQIS